MKDFVKDIMSKVVEQFKGEKKFICSDEKPTLVDISTGHLFNFVS